MPDNSQLAHELESLLASVLNGQIQMEMIKDQLKKDINQLRADFEGYLIENKEFIGEIDADADTKHIPLRELYLFEKKIKHLYGINSEIHQDFMSYFILEDFSKGFRHFEKVVSELAERFGKNIKVNIQESAIKVCLPEYISLLSSLVHVFRNAVDHGIEEEYAREEVWKKPQAIIDISFNEIMIDDKKHIRVVIADDGQGLDAHLIKQNCLKNGLLKHEELLLINNEEALQLIFCQGLSTAENITDISGRGIGLAAVKYQVELIGGKIWAETKLGHWTKIIFEVPLLMENK
jgi:two-component system chemotaxis sensor kinase CheA